MGYFSNSISRHSPWRVALVVTNALLFVIASGITEALEPMLFRDIVRNVSKSLPTKVRPTGDTFSIRYLIYAWQGLSLLYTLSLLCRRNAEGDYLYVKPAPVHPGFYMSYALSTAFAFGWGFFTEGDQKELAFVSLVFTGLCLYICGALVCRSLDQAASKLQSLDRRADIWLTTVLVLNGVAVYAAWVTVVTWLSLGSVLQYRVGVDGVACAWVTLSLLALLMLVWFTMETFILDRYLRYCFSQYIALLVGFAGIFGGQYEMTEPEEYMYFIVALLGLSCLLAIVKVLVMVTRGLRDPIVYGEGVDSLSSEEGVVRRAAETLAALTTD